MIWDFPSLATLSGGTPVLDSAERFLLNPGEIGVGVGPVNGLPV